MSNKHGHPHNGVSATPEESIALLNYMISHNSQHADELYNLGNTLSGEAKQLVHSAVMDFEKANNKLERSLEIIKKATLIL